jgi:hypothetical protein
VKLIVAEDERTAKVLYAGPPTEYLERELGWIQVGVTKDLSQVNGSPVVVLVGQSFWEVLNLFRLKGKFHVYLYADETYKLIQNLFLFLNPRVKKLLRSYPVHDLLFARTVTSRKMLLNLFNECSSPKEKLLFSQSLLAGIVMLFRQSLIKCLQCLRFGSDLESYWIPLGYTNRFAKLFCAELGVQDPLDSLIDYACHRCETSMQGKDLQIVFRGQRGKFQRQKFLQAAEDAAPSIPKIIKVNRGFAGRNETGEISSILSDPYVKELLKSIFALCPPGNYSSETFRYWESLLCGCVPIVADVVPSDLLRKGKGLRLAKLNELVSSNWRGNGGVQLANQSCQQLALWRFQLEKVNLNLTSV